MIDTPDNYPIASSDATKMRKKQATQRSLRTEPIFCSLKDALRHSMVKHSLPEEAFTKMLLDLEAAEFEQNRWKNAMLDLFLCGEIEISTCDPVRGAVFTATETAESEKLSS